MPKRPITTEAQLIRHRNSFVKKHLRRASLQWRPRSEAVKLARKERGRYECSSCKELFDRPSLEVDHRETVVPLNTKINQSNKEIDWNIYIPRLLCGTDNFRLLCRTCHEILTSSQNAMRNHYKKKRK